MFLSVGLRGGQLSDHDVRVFGNMRIVGEVMAEALLMAALVIWAHRGNIKRLLHGKESRFTWHK